MLVFLYSFLFSGIMCLLGEILLNVFKLKPGVVTSIFVSLGSFLDIFNIYDYFIDKVGGGALVVLPSFGHSLIHSALNSAKSSGLLGLMSGMFSLTSTGITSAIIFAFFLSIIFKSKG